MSAEPTVQDDLALAKWVIDAMCDEWPRRFPDAGETNTRILAAPDALARVSAELERLRGAEHVRQTLIAEADACRDHMERAEREVGRLRDGLRRIAESPWHTVDNARDFARSLLASSPHETGGKGEM